MSLKPQRYSNAVCMSIHKWAVSRRARVGVLMTVGRRAGKGSAVTATGTSRRKAHPAATAKCSNAGRRRQPGHRGADQAHSNAVAASGGRQAAAALTVGRRRCGLAGAGCAATARRTERWAPAARQRERGVSRGRSTLPVGPSTIRPPIASPPVPPRLVWCPAGRRRAPPAEPQLWRVLCPPLPPSC